MSVSNAMCSKVLHALNEHWRHNYTAPSLRELAIAVDCNSTSVMKSALKTLAESGDIHYNDDAWGKARAATPMWVVKAIKTRMSIIKTVDGGYVAFPKGHRMTRLEETFASSDEAEIEGWMWVYNHG